MAKALCYLALIVSLFGSAHASQCSNPASLTTYAYQVAKADGHKHPRLLVGVIRVESDAGGSANYRVVKAGVGKQASTFYGVGQLTMGAAREVMRRFPVLWSDFNTKTDEELKARLILDDRFNVQVASKYLLMMGVNSNPDKGVAAYNVGIGGVELIDYRAHAYTQKVKRAAGSR